MAGVASGEYPPAPHKANTAGAGGRVGHTTVRGDNGHTGVTAILPPGDQWFRDRVPAAIVVGNGFGKLLGVTQVRELGELETPILLTCTLCVWRAADAMVDWLLARPGMENVRSINAVVGETNDGGLNDIRSRPVTREHVVAALESAAGGAVQEGSVGAGAGTVAFGWKGGIGTSSRLLPSDYGGYTVGVLVQSNYGGILTINGAPVGRELGRVPFRTSANDMPGEGRADADAAGSVDGSIMIIVATDAPLGPDHLERLGRRALFGLARTGATMSNGSGDYVIAFSTATSVRRSTAESSQQVTALSNETLTPLFQAVAEATEEAVYNSLFRATTTHGHGGTVEGELLRCPFHDFRFDTGGACVSTPYGHAPPSAARLRHSSQEEREAQPVQVFVRPQPALGTEAAVDRLRPHLPAPVPPEGWGTSRYFVGALSVQS